ncbi:unnamed protein product [Polarella glacialis]|uniref:JmjC domain-containing protein n=1 Tax=Polarella glacialis TaxID=89957 RepID=A0A813J2B5_POLGL|nr:unnamed protein product [Polarella glacialis]
MDSRCAESVRFLGPPLAGREQPQEGQQQQQTQGTDSWFCFQVRRRRRAAARAAVTVSFLCHVCVSLKELLLEKQRIDSGDCFALLRGGRVVAAAAADDRVVAAAAAAERGVAAAAADESFGWSGFDLGTLPPHSALRKGTEDFSDVPIFDAQNVPEHVKTDPSWAEKPFILRGDASLAALQKDFGRSVLLQTANLGNLSIRVVPSWSLLRGGGDEPHLLALSDYIEHLDLYEGDTRLEPAYAIDPSYKIPGLPDSQVIDTFIRAWNRSHFENPASRIIFLGGAESGVGWHRHGAAVQMTIHGRKRWFLYPRGTSLSPLWVGLSIADWLNSIYPSLPAESLPLEFIQKSGDVVYIPDGWYHAVINLADTLAVSIQSFSFEPAEAAQDDT